MSKMKKLEELGIGPAPWRCICYNYKTNDKYNYLGEVRFADNRLLCCDINQPDAKLAAAAPELYECLREEFEKVCTNDGKCTDCQFVGQCRVKEWRTALAKASGEDNGKQV